MFNFGQATLRNSLLLHGVPSVRVVEYQLIAHMAEREGSFVTCNTLIRKVLEDLLKGCLTHAVLLNA